MSDPSSRMSSCESCGVQFEAPQDEVVSSRVLCPKCAAERRAKLRAAKAAAGAAPAATPAASPSASPAARPATPAPAARPAARAPQTAAAPVAAAPAAAATHGSSRAAAEPKARAAKAGGSRAGGYTHSGPDHHPQHDPDYDPRKAREQERKKIMKLAWMVTGGLTLIVCIVLAVVFSKQNERKSDFLAAEKVLDDFQEWVRKVDLTSEVDLKAAKERINAERKVWRGKRIESVVNDHKTKIDQRLSEIIRTRGLIEKLVAIEQQMTAAPTVEGLRKQYAAVRDSELVNQATEAGGEHKIRHDRLMKQVYKNYIDALRAAATAAASATTGEALAPFGELEDVLRTVRNDAEIANDLEAQAIYKPMWGQVYTEINSITSRLFDEAYKNKVAWTDLLADPSAWQGPQVTSFTPKFAGGTLTLTNAADGSTGGLSYFPKGDGWRDYIIDMEIKLDSGSFSFYTRIGDKMDSKEGPALTAGPTSKFNVLLEVGKVYQLQVSTIGNSFVVLLDGTMPYTPDDIQSSKSRKGEPGIAVQAGTNLTISKMKVRLLR